MRRLGFLITGIFLFSLLTVIVWGDDDFSLDFPTSLTCHNGKIATPVSDLGGGAFGWECEQPKCMSVQEIYNILARFFRGGLTGSSARRGCYLIGDSNFLEAGREYAGNLWGNLANNIDFSVERVGDERFLIIGFRPINYFRNLRGLHDPPGDPNQNNSWFLEIEHFQDIPSNFSLARNGSFYDEAIDHYLQLCLDNVHATYNGTNPTLTFMTSGEPDTEEFEMYFSCEALENIGLGKNDPVTADHLLIAGTAFLLGETDSSLFFSLLDEVTVSNRLLDDGSLLDSLSFDSVSGDGVIALPGKVGDAAFFDGVGSLTIPHDFIYHFPQQEVTFMAWVKVDEGFTGPAQIVGKRGFDQSKGYVRIILTDEGKFAFEVKNLQYPTTYSYNDGEWYHLAYVLNGHDSRARIYLNGEGFTIPMHWPFDVENDADIMIGNSLIEPGFQGGIDEVKIFHRMLTDEEVLGVYNAENSKS